MGEIPAMGGQSTDRGGRVDEGDCVDMDWSYITLGYGEGEPVSRLPGMTWEF